jgi:mono/diheme cytochrome c family protein
LSACLPDSAGDAARDPSQWPISQAELRTEQAPSDPGEAAYRRTCIACHGADGRGADASKTAGKTAADFSAHAGVLTKPDNVLLAAILDGTTGPIGVMPPHRGLLQGSEASAVLAFVRRTFGPGIAPEAGSPDGGPDGGPDAETPTN